MDNDNVHFIACGIFQPELEQVLNQIQTEGLFDCVFEVEYLQAGLHSNLDALKKDMIRALDLHANEKTIFLYGSKCHPELDAILDRYPVTGFSSDNCIPLMTGENIDGKNAKTFFLTTGWSLKTPMSVTFPMRRCWNFLNIQAVPLKLRILAWNYLGSRSLML